MEKLRNKPEKSDQSDQSSRAVGTTSRIPVAEPKIRPVSPQPPSWSPTVSPLHSPVSQFTSLPTPPKPEPPKPQAPVKAPEPVRAPEPVKLEPPAKPPRSPSPHPLRTEAFEEIEYEDEEDEEEEASTDGEENSVISSSPRRNQMNSAPSEHRHKN